MGQIRIRRSAYWAAAFGVSSSNSDGCTSAGAALAYDSEDLDRLQATGSCQDCDLSAADLSDRVRGPVDLRRANLRGAVLAGADLAGAQLSGANLSGADLSAAILDGANLTNANLEGANLERALLRDANLSRANLRGAVLTEADLYEASLQSADLHEATLAAASLEGSDLTAADLRDADLAVLGAFHDGGVADARLPLELAQRLERLAGVGELHDEHVVLWCHGCFLSGSVLLC